MSYTYWSNMVWGINISNRLADEAMLKEMCNIIRAIEEDCYDDFPESFRDACGDFLPRYSFLETDTARQSVMKLYGERIAAKVPYVYDLLKHGAEFFAVPNDASDLEGMVLLGFGMYDLPFPNGTQHLPKAFLDETQHFSWVLGG